MTIYRIGTILILLINVAFSQQGVKIAPVVSTPDPSAIMDIEADNNDVKGILIPRINLVSRTNQSPVTNPANSLLVFNLSNTGNTFNDVQPGYYYWSSDSTKWIRLATESKDQQNIDSVSLTGNMLTVYIENGNPASVDLSSLIDDADNDPANELVSLFDLVGDSLTLTEGNNSYYIHRDSIGSDNQNIIGSSLDGLTNQLTIGIEGGTSETIDLSALRDHDWYVENTTNQPQLINDNIYTLGNVGIGTNSPTSTLDITGNIKVTDGTEGAGKVLTSDANGLATWEYPGPAGMVIAFAGNTAPNGFLYCDGSAVSRVTYSNLFSIIGTTYGVGDGTNTFNLPDLRGEFIRGFDDGRGADPARTLGSNQLASPVVGDDNNSPDLYSIQVNGYTTQFFDNYVPDYASLFYYYSQSPNPYNIQTNPGGMLKGSRPRNVAMKYFIKF